MIKIILLLILFTSNFTYTYGQTVTSDTVSVYIYRFKTDTINSQKSDIELKIEYYEKLLDHLKTWQEIETDMKNFEVNKKYEKLIQKFRKVEQLENKLINNVLK